MHFQALSAQLSHCVPHYDGARKPLFTQGKTNYKHLIVTLEVWAKTFKNPTYFIGTDAGC